MRIEPRVLALIASACLGLGAAPARAALDDAAAQALAKKSGCAKCHKVDKPGAGPSYLDIAAKRKGQADAIERMTKAARNGSKGTYGSEEMDPVSAEKINDRDLLEFLSWILAK